MQDPGTEIIVVPESKSYAFQDFDLIVAAFCKSIGVIAFQRIDYVREPVVVRISALFQFIDA